ncbi:3-deoxy-D-manno-octulosonate 8-phosphate phosphatase (KDO 8-P phosphatase) [Marinospirillum celere]|uniref:3-deoxy-D-manno-octulosonate 8-phosphate phosphatase KdsC n=1 Tax=Marinospirillum celere TaxID=1122252 RepID=A0A1I1FXG2_9GAMM|nr:HAD-IIIA family hydrolase [Marinospirillum celere]SFC03951.1 3-deoxy-D-manno-octulosonate 8-phosphate phosphatase (KDO 8-P phosphatase) [Marinospirillum celere]
MDLSNTLLDKLRPLRLLALDVDGVLTDGSLYFHADGGETKSFNTQDGQGLKLLQASGVELAIITGRDSSIVSQRAAALKINWVMQAREDKLKALTELVNKLGYSWEQVAYCGDDLPDLAAIRRAGFGASVANAPEYIQNHSDYTTRRPGGQGAVRELTDMIMQAQGTWQACINHYLFNQQ